MGNEKRVRVVIATLSTGFAVGCIVTGPVFGRTGLPEPMNEEALAIEAPVVQRILRRAYALENERGKSVGAESPAHLYCLAARLGSLEAQYRLGRMLLDGRGTDKDTDGAATVLSIASGSGHQSANTKLESIGLTRESVPDCLDGH